MSGPYCAHRFTPVDVPPALDRALAVWHTRSAADWWDSTEDHGGCLEAARGLALILDRAGYGFEILRYTALPEDRTTVQHVVGFGPLVVDLIARQWLVDASGPLVAIRDEYEDLYGPPLACCPTCGSTGDLDYSLRFLPLDQHQCPGPQGGLVIHT